MIRTVAVALAIASFGGPSTADEMTEGAFRDLVLLTCLPHVATGHPVVEGGVELRRLSAAAGRNFSQDAPGSVFAPSDDRIKAIVLVNREPGHCAIDSYRSDADAVHAFADEWFGSGTPFSEMKDEFGDDGVRERHFVGRIGPTWIGVIVATVRERKLARIVVLELQR